MGVALCLMSLAVRTKPPDPTSNEPANCSLLLKLPDELLLFIAQRLCDNGDLCRLSLVCRKLKDIAQEALLKEVVLPTYTLCSMRELVRALCDRPDLCDKIRSVDLDGYSCPGHPTHVFGGPEEDYFYKCRGLVGEEVFDKTIDRYASVQPTWPRLREQPFFLDVLIAACPNIQGLTLRLPGVLRDQVFLGNGGGGLLKPFFGETRDLLEKRLRTLTIRESALTIPESDDYMLLQTPNVTLSGFSHLTFLSIPTDALMSMSQIPTAVAQALPSSLRHLQIKPCNRFINLWFPELNAAYPNGVLPKLCRIDAHFQDSLKDSFVMIDQGRGHLEPFRYVLGSLKHNYGVSVRGYNKSGEFTGYLLEELEARSLLSDTELWYPCGKDVECSSIVARTAEGAPRSRSREEICTYINRDRMSQESAITRIFRFKPDVDLYMVAPLSFSTDANELPKVVKPRFSSDFARWLASVAATQRKAESALREAPAQLCLKSPIEGDPTVTATTMILQGPVGSSYPHMAFDPNQWLDVTFFGDLRSKRSPAKVLFRGKNNQRRKDTVTSVVRGCGKARCVKARLAE